jgi:D-alanyl-D-alanine endopeptidase (penicillin-binding protein 7)
MRKFVVGVVSVLFAGLLAQPVVALETSGKPLRLESSAAIIIDQEQGAALYAKNARAVMPIASITKLMTAIVVLDARLPLDQPLEVTHDDLDFVKGTRSRLGTGTVLTRREMLKLALMASENRAASALGRHYPGGFPAFVSAMNRKARELGMRDTRFVDSTGLNPDNVSTAQDLVRLVEAGLRYPVIRDFTTSHSHFVEVDEGRRSRVLSYNNSNGLVRARNWDIGLSKTGYISEAGRCLVMQAQIAAKPVIIVLLDSWGKMSRIGDANRIRQWLEGETRARELRPVRVRTQPTPVAGKAGRGSRQDARRVNAGRA